MAVAMHNATVYPFGQYQIHERRRLKVIVIGAGYSGIGAGIRFPQKVQNIDFTIYEKNASIGEAWYSNGYSGSYVPHPDFKYQFTFDTNPGMPSIPGPGIRAYLEHVVQKYKLTPYIKLEHEVVHARYDEAQGKWHLKIRRPSLEYTNDKPSYHEFEDTADFVFCSVGGLNRRTWPAIEGLKDFKGKLLYSADQHMDGWQKHVQGWTGKTVGVIGSGPSAMGVVHALQPYVGKLHNFWGGKVWPMLPLFVDMLAEMTRRAPGIRDYTYSEKDKEKFHGPEPYKDNRRVSVEPDHACTLRNPEREAGKHNESIAHMKQLLAKKPRTADHIKRPTPDLGYLAILCKDNINFVPKNIQRITDSGLETMDGQHYQLDIIICAIANDTSFKPPLSVVGRSGLTLQQRYAQSPVRHSAICTDGFPNWFGSLGPSFAASSPLIRIEHEVEYAAAALSKIQCERLKSIEVKKEVVENSDQCLKKRPQWEDYNYEHLDNVYSTPNWFGAGTHVAGQRTYSCTIL